MGGEGGIGSRLVREDIMGMNCSGSKFHFGPGGPAAFGIWNIPRRQSTRRGPTGSERHGRPGPRPRAHRPSSMIWMYVSGKKGFLQKSTYIENFSGHGINDNPAAIWPACDHGNALIYSIARYLPFCRAV